MNRRAVSVFFLGFSSGLPLVLLSSTLQAWYTQAGVDLISIGFLSLVGQPYIYKWLWAPFLDRFTPLSCLGRHRGWIVLMQIAVAGGLLWMAELNPKYNPMGLAMIALLTACFSASQDIAIDAYRTDLLSSQERGWGAALTTIGYRGALLVSGAGALVLADQWGWRFTYYVMTILMLLEIFVTYYSPQVEVVKEYEAGQHGWLKTLVLPWVEFSKRRGALSIFVFLALYKLCDALALALNTTFLLRGVGFTLTELGVMSKTLGLTAAVIGSMIGGVLVSFFGLYRSLLYFGLLQLIASLPFVLLSVVGKSDWLMGGAVFFEYFCGSLSNVSLIVLLMSLCDARYTASQFAMLSAVVSCSRVFVGPLAAYLVQHIGWTWFYVSTVFLGLPAIVLVIWLRRNRVLFVT